MAGGANKLGALAFVVALSSDIAKYDNNAVVRVICTDRTDRNVCQERFVRLRLYAQCIVFYRLIAAERNHDRIGTV